MGAPLPDLVFGALLGLIIGSFLNVVIHRLPRMLERQWAIDSGTAQAGDAPAFNLLTPRSRCPHCGHPVAWHQNIPVLSYLLLRGRCGACQTPYGQRYVWVEGLTGALFALTVWQHGLSWTAGAWCSFAALLVALAFIDFDTQYLPDDLNYPLLWLGLIAASMGWTVPLDQAVWGAVWGYLSLWTVYQAYRLLTGKIGMGHGDFKLLAALGAWFGYGHLLAIVLLSSLVGSVLGLTLLLRGREIGRDTPLPFGPFLAGAGLLCLVLGPDRLAAWLPFAFPMSRLAG